MRAAIWVSTSGIVIVLTGAIMDRRVVALLPVDLVTRLALADLVFVSGVAFLFSIPWGSLVGGARHSAVSVCARSLSGCGPPGPCESSTEWVPLISIERAFGSCAQGSHALSRDCTTCARGLRNMPMFT